MALKKIITVDLGGTKILSALLNTNKEILDRVKVPTKISGGAEPIVKSISNSVKKLLERNKITGKQVAAVCLGVPGTVNPATGLIGAAPNLGIENYNIKEALNKFIDIPILIENDVNLAGLGIKKFEMNDEVNNMLVIFIGTGIGSALFFNGKIYRGTSFFAGEIGHMKVSKKGMFGNSKNKNTFENLASRTAVVAAISKDIKSGKSSILEKYVNNNKRIKSKTIKSAVKKGDKITVKYIDKSMAVTGTVLGSVTTLLNVDKIVLGGGVVEAMSDYVLPKVKTAFDKAVLPEPGKAVEIVSTKLGDDAPLYGGLALAEEFLES